MDDLYILLSFEYQKAVKEIHNILLLCYNKMSLSEYEKSLDVCTDWKGLFDEQKYLLTLCIQKYPSILSEIKKTSPELLPLIENTYNEIKDSDMLRCLYEMEMNALGIKDKELLKPSFYNNYDYVALHKQSFSNKASLKKGNKCGCFHCQKIFNTDEISDWVNNDETAMCPYCGIDSVLGEDCGYPLTRELLYIMHTLFFDTMWSIRGSLYDDVQKD